MPDGSCMPMTGGVKQEWGSQSKGWLSLPAQPQPAASAQTPTAAQQ